MKLYFYMILFFTCCVPYQMYGENSNLGQGTSVDFSQLKRRYPRNYTRYSSDVPQIEGDDFGFAPYCTKQKKSRKV